VYYVFVVMRAWRLINVKRKLSVKIWFYFARLNEKIRQAREKKKAGD